VAVIGKVRVVMFDTVRPRKLCRMRHRLSASGPCNWFECSRTRSVWRNIL